jgi:uncharacterized membrane protein
LPVGFAPGVEGVHRDADEEHGDGAEHERRTEDGADGDAVGRPHFSGEDAADDGDDRYHRLRQHRADRREDAPGPPLANVELVTDPLDAVGEYLGAEQQQRERSQQQRGVHRASAADSHDGDGTDHVPVVGAPTSKRTDEGAIFFDPSVECRAMSDPGSDEGVDPPEAVAVEEILSQLQELEGAVDDPRERREVRRAIRLVDRIPEGSIGDDLIRKFTRRDIAEGFVGAILVSLPMLVEDGVFEIAETLLAEPALLALNVLFVFGMTAGLLYFADFREVRITRPIFGVVPRRFAAVLLVAFVTAAFTMTLWGRLEWSEPVDALSRICVVWTVSSFGAALGDILPGESSAKDINDELDDLGDRLGIGDEEGRF